MNPHAIVVIMGAAVWPGDTPSNAMRRRVRGALQTLPSNEPVIYLVSGGVGKYPPSEAEVMRRLLIERGVDSERIVIDDVSNDTLESVRNCAAILRQTWPELPVYVSSDTYHIPRCRLLFAILGLKTKASPVESGRSQNTTYKWFYYCLRELAATPWDCLLALLSKLRIK
jgi:uncharacterized SAM-binding protein YcdF (DUF218 family)